MKLRYELRPAVAADLDAIESLERATETAPHWPRSTYAAILSASDCDPATQRRCLIVARTGSGLIGFAVGLLHPAISQTPKRIAELETIAVAAAARRVGAGRALSEAVLEWSRSNGATEAILEVRAASAGASALYAALGFRETGRRPRYYSDPADDAVLMRLELQPTSAPAPASSLA